MGDAGDVDPAPETSDARHDPLMILFVAAVVVFLIGCAVLMLIANARLPAGL